MKKTLLFASMGMLAVVTGTLSMANAREYRTEAGKGVLSGHEKVHMQLASDSQNHDEHADRDEASGSRDPNKGPRPNNEADHGMLAIANTAGPGQPGHGWLFFSHPAADRAVVISPRGEYYFSQGEGLRLVATAQPRS